MDTARASIVKIVSKEDGIRRTGTGFVVQVEPDAVYIATASHVVKNDSAPQIEFLARRNRPVTAAIVRTEGDDLQSGIALLVVRGKENMPERLRPLPFATTDELKGGQEVIAIGFGLGQGDWAVIRANVASLDGRDIRLDGRIEEGNSGGPILKGYQVVGLITGTQGYGHATPAMFVERILRGWGLEVTRADTPAVRPPLGAPDRRTGTPGSDQRYALRSAGATQGRRTLSEHAYRDARRNAHCRRRSTGGLREPRLRRELRNTNPARFEWRSHAHSCDVSGALVYAHARHRKSGHCESVAREDRDRRIFGRPVELLIPRWSTIAG